MDEPNGKALPKTDRYLVYFTKRSGSRIDTKIDTKDERPMTLRERVEERLKREIAPALLLDGNGIEVLEVTNGIASVRLTGVCAGCPASIMTVITTLEDQLRKLIPEVEILEVVP